jgi:hypothetical protein
MKHVLFISVILFSVSVFTKSSTLKSTVSKKDTNYYSSNPDKYLSKQDIKCNADNCPAPNFCGKKTSACYCEKGLANYPFTGINDVYCQYEQHSQLKSFLFELLFNLGIGHFIIGRYIMGAFKLIIMFIPIMLLIMSKVGCVKMGFKEGTCGTIVQIIAIAFGIGAFAWWITDAIMFGKNKYRDRNEVPLKKW